MEIAEQNAILFIGMDITKRGDRLETSVHIESLRTLVCFSIILSKPYWQTVQTLFTFYYDPKIVLTTCHDLLLLRFLRNATGFALSSLTGFIQLIWSIHRLTNFCAISMVKMHRTTQVVIILLSFYYCHLKITIDQFSQKANARSERKHWRSDKASLLVKEDRPSPRS